MKLLLFFLTEQLALLGWKQYKVMHSYRLTFYSIIVPLSANIFMTYGLLFLMDDSPLVTLVHFSWLLQLKTCCVSS